MFQPENGDGDMTIGDNKICQVVRSFLDRQDLEYEEKDEQYDTKFDLKRSATRANVIIYHTGKIVIGGKDSPLKDLLQQMKESIEMGGALPGRLLPIEIHNFPETIQEKIPDVDPVVVRFVKEAIICYEAGSMLGTAFMLGAASEKAILLLIDSYKDAIKDETHREKFAGRVNNRTISTKFEEFKRSYSGCRSRPTDPVLCQDLDQILEGTFQFCRITRNEVGHPQIVPDLDQGVILAQLGYFSTYLGRIYGLTNHFKNTPLQV
jgi:hypothetical protein